MRIINEEQRVRLDRLDDPVIEGVVRVRGIHAGRTFAFGPVRSHEIPELRAGPPILAFAIAPALAVLAGLVLRRKGR